MRGIQYCFTSDGMAGGINKGRDGKFQVLFKGGGKFDLLVLGFNGIAGSNCNYEQNKKIKILVGFEPAILYLQH